ncbi:hypothetical protein PPL_02519 [Heterostelium album PN500]|uniref:B box-type domain-containing protein n=1 Tax=Heterostelium pallidum (strain ATCC 26659 / Pp 5 / PN500) TaxID=670386 RepID=D3B2B0_HETP5|nr:hypothetical protein PPL_02519 [Heterostelium album PN500]EFA84485.1 hypothetical protein PPL_02519 [Heterostelium album PN500]|eukprot:XP_020436599.1 hypothetical protein PPL_02519 [Heterostelium album PN500]
MECQKHDCDYRIVCYQCTKLMCLSCLIIHNDQYREHQDLCDHIDKFKSDLNSILCIDRIINNNNNNNDNVLFIYKRIKSIWLVIKESSLHIQSLTSKESEISHEYLRILEHKLKKSINNDIDTHNQQVNHLINELKHLINLNNSNNSIINNDSDNNIDDVEEIKQDHITTDDYSLSTIVKSINENSTLSFIENNRLIFNQHQQKHQQRQQHQKDHTSFIVDQYYKSNSDLWLLDSIYQYSKQFNPQHQLQIVQPFNIYKIDFNVDLFRSMIHRSISVTAPSCRNTLFSLHRYGATLIRFIDENLFHTEEIELPQAIGHKLDLFRRTTMSLTLINERMTI